MYFDKGCYRFLLTSIECFIRFIVNANWMEDAIPLVLLITVIATFGVFGYVFRFDFKADYNLGRERNFQQVFGWGLWMFPLRTSLEDGMHFEIR
ncbi:hypothetical protein OSTOST_06784 [Ostertagia ostertagi]